MKEQYRTTRFAGFQDGLQGAQEHMSTNLDKALTLADNIYASQGNDAVEAIEGNEELNAARHMAESIVAEELLSNEDKEQETPEGE